jgi:CHAT domain-containing protein/tRNA A-37 threonylcarbamoyl transferase component Bud32
MPEVLAATDYPWVGGLRKPPAGGPQRLEWLAEVREDQQRRRRHGKLIPAEDYIAGLRELGADREALLDVICSDFLLRLDAGEAPAAHDYARRFPEFAAELTDLLALFALPGEAADAGSGPPVWLGSHRLGRPLGSGGMGMVFEAEDVALGRTVALKVMRPEMASRAGARERFLAEARAMAAIAHDHVVPVFAVGQEGDVPYFTMQLLAGESLQDRLDRHGDGNALPLAEVMRIGRQMAQGLAAAHARGLIHRDIKPGNIFLESPGPVASASPPQADFRVRILDFGVASAVGANWERPRVTGRSDDEHFSLGTLLRAGTGTPAYMSPEQAAGASDLDARSDLFSLGTVLYQLATGRLPFSGDDSCAILTAVREARPRAPRELRPDLSEALDNLIRRLLAPNRADRPSGAAEVARVLGAMSAAAPGPATAVAAGPSGYPLSPVAGPDPCGATCGRAARVPAGARQMASHLLLALAMPMLPFGLGAAPPTTSQDSVRVERLTTSHRVDWEAGMTAVAGRTEDERIAELRRQGGQHAESGRHGEAMVCFHQLLEINRSKCQRLAPGSPEFLAFDLWADDLPDLDGYLSSLPQSAVPDAVGYANVWPFRGLVSRLLRRHYESAHVALHPDDPVRAAAADRLRAEELDRLGPTDLAAALPSGAAFVDLVRYHRVGPGGIRVTRYVGFVVRPDRVIRRVDLGADAAAIDQAVRTWRQRIEHGLDTPEDGARVGGLLWEPIAHALAPGTEIVYLAADGELAHLPWAALPGRQPGTVLLEDLAIASVPHGAYLLEKLKYEPRYAGKELVLALGDIDPGNGVDHLGRSREMQSVIAAAGARDRKVLRTAEATPDELRNWLPRARYAHLSVPTFLDRPPTSKAPESAKPAPVNPTRAVERGSLTPLDHLGLVLAGARGTAVHPNAGGRITAQALAHLPLEGVRLCVLTPSKAARGQVGEDGALRLRHVLHLAGCANVVTGLWHLEDDATAELMAPFYEQLWREGDRPMRALCKAQLAVYRHGSAGPAARRTPTRQWAALVLSGLGW